jgi:predicted HTH transcriptional regulator
MFSENQNEKADPKTTDMLFGKSIRYLILGGRTAKTIAATLGLTDRQVERILSKWKNEGRIVRHGAGKNGYWEVL